MAQQFNEDDRDRSVVTTEGDTIGRVRDVERDRATVERTDEHDSLTDEIKDMLGWDDDDEEHELRQEHVDRREENRLHLRPRR